LRGDLCLCALAPKIAVRTEVLLVMHTKEWRRSSNTGQLLRLCTPNVKIKIHGRPGDLAGGGPGTWSDASGWVDRERTRPVVLYPSDDAIILSRDLAQADPRPLTIIVPDGSWSQARHIVKRVKGLDAFPRVALPHAAVAMLRPRRNIDDSRMSTYEAIAQALAVLEDEALAAPLADFFRQIAARMLCMRGRVSKEDVDALA
jgi:DTW domain-containing protein YfiP